MSNATLPPAKIDFLEFIADLDHGRINQQLSEQLAKVVDAVKDTHKAGALTIKISVSQEGSMAQVDVSSTVKTPQHPMNGTIFFFGTDRALVRDNPRQMKLRDVDPPAPPRVVGLPSADRKSAAAGERGEDK